MSSRPVSTLRVVLLVARFLLWVPFVIVLLILMPVGFLLDVVDDLLDGK